MNKWREKKRPVLSIIYCLLYSIYCLLYTWNCKIFHVLCVLPLYCLLHRDDKSDTKRWHHDHGLHIKIGHGKSKTSQVILTNGLNNVSITRSTPHHADSPRNPTMQCDDHFVPPSSQGSRGLQTHPLVEQRVKKSSHLGRRFFYFFYLSLYQNLSPSVSVHFLQASISLILSQSFKNKV